MRQNSDDSEQKKKMKKIFLLEESFSFYPMKLVEKLYTFKIIQENFFKMYLKFILSL